MPRSFEGELVAEILELLDEAVLVACGVAASSEVVAAEVAVVDVVGEQCQQMTRIECPTATAAFFLPIRRDSRQNWADR
jgi:hypothetical protein